MDKQAPNGLSLSELTKQFNFPSTPADRKAYMEIVVKNSKLITGGKGALPPFLYPQGKADVATLENKRKEEWQKRHGAGGPGAGGSGSGSANAVKGKGDGRASGNASPVGAGGASG